jgi:hypothetical protein
MFLYNEYQLHEHHKDLLRLAEQARLAKQVFVERLLVKRFGWLLLRWGARLTAQESSDCQRLETRGGQTVMVCPA